MSHVIESESIEAYRNRVMVYATELWQEKDQAKRATLAMYLADVTTTLARLEAEVLQQAAEPVAKV